MDIHYNAFISYRHHPDDIRVASQIHKLLEHYRVPRAIRQKSGGITRLFRDKEELPITSNLTDDITRALENSDYLIVICSTHTRESTWVRREIETFLKTHDRSRVLTVLVNGEPYDTIPDILLREERVDPVTGETELVDIEPLSCDWRLPLRQARREELPRLAAALLGCGYDELRRRERLYRTRRMVAALSAAMAATLCFTAYVMHNSMEIQKINDQLALTNNQLETANIQLENANTDLENANAEIQANLNEALINQSQYLASSADKLLEEGDRMTALLLALEALPEYEGQRPYVAAAEYALVSALGAYEMKESLVAAGSFNCGALVSDFRVTQDGNTIYILDARDVITVWDTYSFERLSAIYLNHEVDTMMVTGGGNLLVLDTGMILSCYDRVGQLLWSMTGDLWDIAFLSDRSTVMVGETLSVDGERFYRLHYLDPETGAQLREPVQTASGNILYFLREEYSPDTPLLLKKSDYPSDYLMALHPDTGALMQLGSEYAYLYRCGVTNDGNLLALVMKEESSGLQGSYLGFLMTAPETLTLQCFSPETGKLLWERAITTYVYSTYTTLEIIPGSDDILCQAGNLFLVVDSATGEIKASSESSSYVMWTNVRESYTRAMLQDGSIGSFHYEDSYCGFIPCAQDDLISVDVQNGYDYYTANELGSRVTVYRYISDVNWNSIGTGTYAYPYEWQTWGDYVALEGYDKVQLIDGSQGVLLWEVQTSGAEIFSFSPDGATLWVAGDYSRSLLAIDTATGAVSEWELPRKAEGLSPYSGEYGWLTTSPISRELIVCDGFVYYLAEYFSNNQIYLFRYDLAAQAYDFWELYTWDPATTSYNKYGRLVAAAGDHALIWNQPDGTLLEFYAGTGESRVIAQGITGLPGFLETTDGTYLLGTADTIQRRTWGGDTALEIPLTEGRAISFCLYESQILALCDDGYLYRFDDGGNLLGRTGLTRYNTFSGSITSSNFDSNCITWDFTVDGDLILGLYSAGNLLDCETWEVRAFLPYYHAYLPGQNVVMLRDTVASNGMGTFPLYSTEDIMSMAKEALNGYTLTEEQRASYGLD